MLLALSACDQPSLDDSDANDAAKDIPGVVRAESDCSNVPQGFPWLSSRSLDTHPQGGRWREPGLGEPGHVVAYCSGEKVQATAKAKVPSLPGYADVAKVDVFQDAP